MNLERCQPTARRDKSSKATDRANLGVQKSRQFQSNKRSGAAPDSHKRYLR